MEPNPTPETTTQPDYSLDGAIETDGLQVHDAEPEVLQQKTSKQKILDAAPYILIANALAIIAMILLRKFIPFAAGEAEVVQGGLQALFNLLVLYFLQRLNLREAEVRSN